MKNTKSKNKFFNFVNKMVSANAETVKLGIDLHARDGVVSAQIDGSLPQRPLRLTHDQIVTLAEELVKAGLKVFACYEAGPCGYGLYRKLCTLGVTAFVVAPVKLTDGRKQKTDGLDAAGLADQLDRYVRGNKKAFTIVTVPSEAEEQARARGRMRDQYKSSRGQWAARGKSLLLAQGFHVLGCWWGSRKWEEVKKDLPAWLVEHLEIIRKTILELDEQEKALKKEIADQVKEPLPVGIGTLTWALLRLEVCDWGRFQNRRQVAGFTGLCPGVEQSGGTRRELSINRHGSPRIRSLLIETAWRMVKWQPNYPPVRQLLERILSGRARRKIIVAAARKLAVDLWRLATGQTTPEKLGLRMPETAAA